jgi:hypothetical protein
MGPHIDQEFSPFELGLEKIIPAIGNFIGGDQVFVVGNHGDRAAEGRDGAIFGIDHL